MSVVLAVVVILFSILRAGDREDPSSIVGSNEAAVSKATSVGTPTVASEPSRAPGTTSAPGLIHVRAEKEGTAVGGNVDVRGDTVVIEASERARAIKGNAKVRAKQVDVRATGGATAIEGDAQFEAPGSSNK